MDSQSFVDAIRAYVEVASVDSTITLLRRPPGRRPEPSLVALSAWFLSLDSAAQEHVREVAALAAGAAAFGFLCVLDGSRVVVDGEGPKGEFELAYVAPDGTRHRIDGPLHELL